MPKFPIKLVTALALAGVSLGDLSSLPAQQPDAGEATISDSPSEPITESEPLPMPGEAGTATGSVIDSSDAGAPVYSQAYADPYGMGGFAGGYPEMPYGGTPIQQGRGWYGYQNSGPYWMRPIRRPIYRVPVQYARYWPTSYYTGVYDPRAGYALPMPMVYQPTDTTQLGFTHQRVPQWQPRANAIPGPPWPPQWHYVTPVGSMNNSAWDGAVYGGYPVADSYGYSIQPGSTSAIDTSTSTPPAVINPDGTATPTPPQEISPMIPAPAPSVE